MSQDDSADRPAKRQRVDGLLETHHAAETDLSTSFPQSTTPAASDDSQWVKEQTAGITERVHPDGSGFTGILKQRYTDFQVNEVAQDGSVTHLNTLRIAKQNGASKPSDDQAEPLNRQSILEETAAIENVPLLPKEAEVSVAKANESVPEVPFELSEKDHTVLRSIFGQELVPKILILHEEIVKHPERRPKDFRTLTSGPIESKDERTQAHQACRKIFNSKLETQTVEDNCIKIMPAPRNIKPRGSGFEKNGIKQSRRTGWDELGGDYLHFTLYKENKDTMEVVSFLASQLKVNNKSFQFGGTKDRRAVTAQQCSAYRIRAEQLLQASRRLNGLTRIGDYSYKSKGIELGEIGGNEFTIALRDCHFPGEDGLDLQAKLRLARSVVDKAVEEFKRDGFINYFGLQRFGTFANSTDTVGTKMLQGNLRGAVEDILQFSPDALAAANDPGKTDIQVSSDDKARAQAIDIFRNDGDAAKALEILPRKFSAESNIIRYMGQKDRKTGELFRRNDYQGALQCIPRTLRLMYVHAYQSLVFNIVAGQRLKLYGLCPVKGDLVIVPKGANAAYHASAGQEVDEQGEVVIRPAVDDSAVTEDDFDRARPLTAADLASGKYSIYDIVLPLPGFDVIYPSNESGKVYETFMASERGGRLDPHDMRRTWKDVSLSGGYRKFLAQPGNDMDFEVKTYATDDEQLIETDLQRLHQREQDPIQEKQDAWRKENGYAAHDASHTEAEQEEPHTKIAVVLKMSLGSSQYATMALRELMGPRGVQTYKPDYGGGR